MEDIKLNSTVFHWPEHIATVFELAQARLLNRRENAEDELKRKVAQFEEKLEFYSKDIEAFRKKEVSRLFYTIVQYCSLKTCSCSSL